MQTMSLILSPISSQKFCVDIEVRCGCCRVRVLYFLLDIWIAIPHNPVNDLSPNFGPAPIEIEGPAVYRAA